MVEPASVVCRVVSTRWPVSAAAESDLHRFPVAHFAHEDHLGGLAQGGPQTVGVGVEVHPELALVEGGLLVGVLVFDRVLQGDDVHRASFVDLVQDGGQAGGLAGARGPGDKDDPVFFLGDLVHGLGQSALRDGRDLGLQLAADDGEVAALGEDVHPEAGLAGQGVGKIA